MNLHRDPLCLLRHWSLIKGQENAWMMIRCIRTSLTLPALLRAFLCYCLMCRLKQVYISVTYMVCVIGRPQVSRYALRATLWIQTNITEIAASLYTSAARNLPGHSRFRCSQFIRSDIRFTSCPYIHANASRISMNNRFFIPCRDWSWLCSSDGLGAELREVWAWWSSVE